MAVPTTYTYTATAKGISSANMVACTGVPVPTTMTTAASQTEAILFPDVLTATQKSALDQYMTDRGFSFTSQAP